MKTRTATLDWIALTSVLATAVLTCALSVWAAAPIAGVGYRADYYFFTAK